MLNGCDTQKFFGYDYEAEAIGRTVQITGRITDKDSGVPVEEALVNFEGQTALTFNQGEFALEYLLGTDEDFGRFIPVTITNEKYFTLDTSVMIFPTDSEFNAELTFGAPSPLQTTEFELEKFQTTIRDFQGVDDIETVYWICTYWVEAQNDLGGFRQPDTVVMNRTAILDANTAEYRVTAPRYNDRIIIRRAWNVLAIDKAGLRCQIINFFGPAEDFGDM